MGRRSPGNRMGGEAGALWVSSPSEDLPSFFLCFLKPSWSWWVLAQETEAGNKPPRGQNPSALCWEAGTQP